jgi:DMSO/TMAO reductase YedYZ molybdopterin-dependent catalytic subunit
MEASMTDRSPAVQPATTTAHTPPKWWGVLIGLLAAATGLAFGEFVAGFSRVLRSPVLSVGDRVIDRVPQGLKQWAIDNFGPDDKVVLVWTILTVIAIAAGVVGVITVNGRPKFGLGSAALLGVLGAWAGGVGRNTRFVGIFPALGAAVVAAAVLMLGYWLAHPKPQPKRDTTRLTDPLSDAVIDRRRMLVTGGGLALTALVVGATGRSMQQRFNVALERAGVRGITPKVPLPAPPADPSETTLGLSPLITPIKDFYRIDTALSFPSIELSSWKLTIAGMVDQERSYTFDDLMNRELIERDITISCVSNEVGGDLVGNARWVGCRLDDLLAEAGIKEEADQIMGISVDGFTAGFPVETLDGRDAMIALSMNGEPLPVKNGFPARIIVPGIYGYVSAVKWLDTIKLTRFDQEQGYWIPRGWAALAPVKTQSRIDTPGSKISAGKVAIAGVAWAPTRDIKKVEVQVDDGEWREATLGPSLGANAWRQWWLDWEATAGDHLIRCRATDGTGETQTEERARVDPDGATGWHTRRVSVRA